MLKLPLMRFRDKSFHDEISKSLGRMVDKRTRHIIKGIEIARV